MYENVFMWGISVSQMFTDMRNSKVVQAQRVEEDERRVERAKVKKKKMNGPIWHVSRLS